MMNRQAPLFAAAALEQGESLQKMAASGASPLIRHARKKKPDKRKTGATTGVRQQKEELFHSVKNHPRANQLRVGSHSGSAVHSAAPRRFPRILLFLFWTVHGPFSLFLLEEKEKMGGAKDQPSSWLKFHPARRASTSPPHRMRAFFKYHPV